MNITNEIIYKKLETIERVQNVIHEDLAVFKASQGVKNKVGATALAAIFGGMVTVLVKVFSSKVA
jgi:hypothetical protein